MNSEEEKIVKDNESNNKKSESCCIDHDEDCKYSKRNISDKAYNTIKQSLELNKQDLLHMDAKQAKANTFNNSGVNDIYFKIKELISSSSMSGFIDIDLHTDHIIKSEDVMTNVYLHSALTILAGEGYYIEQYPMNSSVYMGDTFPVFKISWR